MTPSDGAAARTEGVRHVGYWRDHLVASRRPQLPYDFRNASEVSPPIAQRINDFIAGHFPNAVCDRCVCKALDFYSSAQAAQITEALCTTSDFDLLRGLCVVCKNERIVVSANRAPTT
jgi:hypothetical protein